MFEWRVLESDKCYFNPSSISVDGKKDPKLIFHMMVEIAYQKHS
jgi:hypothetical protein